MDKVRQPEQDNTPASAAKVQDVAAQNSEAKKPEFVSKGQKFHKWSTYLGIDWVFNTAVGVGFAYWGKYTEMGKRVWSGPLDRFFTKQLGKHIKDEASLLRSVEKGNIFMSIIAGGMFTIPPLMVLENKKVKKNLIKKYDEMFYGKETVAKDPKFQEAYDRLDDEPKKSFAAGMISRFMALAPLLAIVLVPSTRKVSDKIYFNHISGASEKVAGSMGFGPASFKNVSLAEATERNKFIHDSIAMDFGLGLPYAGLHAVFYSMVAGFFAKVFGKKDKKPEAAPKTKMPLPEAMAITSEPVVESTILASREAAPKASHAAREIARKAEAETAAPTLGA